MYIALGIIGFFVVLRLYVWVLSYLKKGKKIGSVSGSLGAKINTGKKLFFYFYSPHCGACRTMTPIIEKLQNKHNDVYMINVTKDLNMGKAFGIMGTPATVLVEKQRIQKYILGSRSEKYLNDLVTRS
jgi:thioredoxin 1